MEAPESEHFTRKTLLSDLFDDIKVAHPDFDRVVYANSPVQVASFSDSLDALTTWILMVYDFLVYALRLEVGEEMTESLSFVDILFFQTNGFLEHFSGRIYSTAVVATKLTYCWDITKHSAQSSDDGIGPSNSRTLSKTFVRATNDLYSLISRIQVLDYARIADRHLEAICSKSPSVFEGMLNGPDIQQRVNTVQDVLDNNDPGLSSKERKVLVRFLYKAAKHCGVLPRRFCVQGVKREGEYPFGCGSFGEVYKGRIGEQKVAVKVCRFYWEPQMKEERHREICKEAFIWKPLDHPNVLPFLGICMDGFPSVGLVSPFLDNGNLMNYMKGKPDLNKFNIAEQICSGLAYLHCRKPEIIHGDLKCANILVDDVGRPRIADFGLARAINISTATASTRTKGTLRWQAPELVYPSIYDGDGRVNTKTDIYAFGMTCLEIYKGHIPFRDQTDWEVVTMARDGVALQRACEMTRSCPWVFNLLCRCCSTESDSRMQAADIFHDREELKGFLYGAIEALPKFS